MALMNKYKDKPDDYVLYLGGTTDDGYFAPTLEMTIGELRKAMSEMGY